MKAGSTGRRGNSNSSYILPDPKLNRIVLGKELKAGSSARTSPCPESSTGQPRQRGAPADRPTGRAGRDRQPRTATGARPPLASGNADPRRGCGGRGGRGQGPTGRARTHGPSSHATGRARTHASPRPAGAAPRPVTDRSRSHRTPAHKRPEAEATAAAADAARPGPPPPPSPGSVAPHSPSCPWLLAGRRPPPPRPNAPGPG